MSTLFSLSGKRAVVTGGGSGLGFAMAMSLAEHGATVEIWGRNKARLDAAVARARARDITLNYRRVDVTDENQIITGFRAVGALDVTIVNAGSGGTPGAFLDSTTPQYRDVMSTNLDGAYWTIRESGRAMVNSGRGGSIIVISSLAAVEGATRNQAYGATKGGVLSLANGVAVELARHGVRVNTVLPGWFQTDMADAALNSDTFAKHVLPRVPARRWGNPDDLAGVAVYLASDASRYQIGSSIVVDGGYSVF